MICKIIFFRNNSFRRFPNRTTKVICLRLKYSVSWTNLIEFKKISTLLFNVVFCNYLIVATCTKSIITDDVALVWSIRCINKHVCHSTEICLFTIKIRRKGFWWKNMINLLKNIKENLVIVTTHDYLKPDAHSERLMNSKLKTNIFFIICRHRQGHCNLPPRSHE